MTHLSATEALAALIALGTVISFLWKAFDLIGNLRERVNSNLHKIELLEQQIEDERDRLTLAVKHVEELASHVRTRTQVDNQALLNKISNIEGFLIKTTDFQIRN